MNILQFEDESEHSSSDEERSEDEQEESSDDQEDESSEPELLTMKDFELIYPDRILFLGPSESGKTTIIRHVINKYISSGKLAGGKKGVFWYGVNYSLEKWLPRGHGMKSINKKQIDEIRTVMRTSFKGKSMIIVFDDVLLESFHNDKWFSDFIGTCRHERIIVLIGIQYLNTISPVMRANIKRLFVTWSNNTAIDLLHKQSTSGDKAKFQSQLTNIKLGQPVLLDFRPSATIEVQRMSVGPLETLL